MGCRKSLFVALLSSIGALGCAPDAEPPARGNDAINSTAIEAARIIDARLLRQTVAVLAGDDFEGRGPASAGDLKTQRFLSAALDRLGYSPGGEDGTWLQPFDIVSVTTTTPETWQFMSGSESIALTYWDEFIVASGVQAPSAIIDDAEVVFVSAMGD